MAGDLKQILRRHRVFWRREKTDRPLMRVTPYEVSREGVPPMRMPLPDGSDAPDGVLLTPEMLDPEVIHADYNSESEKRSFGRTLGAPAEICDGLPATEGDVFAPAAAYPVVPWMEAVLGCPIRVSLRSHSMWAEPRTRSWSPRTARLHVNPLWLNKLGEFTRYLVLCSRGRYLVSTTLMRGVSDMLNATMGDEAFCTALYDTPETIDRLADSSVKIFLETARRQTDYIHRFLGGTCTLFGVWAPGSSIRTQDDASVMISPEQYARFFLPRQETIASAFDFSVIHLHSTGLHIADLLCESSLSAIQVSIDPQPFGPPVSELLPKFQRIMEKKPLIVEGPFTQEELELTLRTLPVEGLFIGARIQSEEDRKRIWDG